MYKLKLVFLFSIHCLLMQAQQKEEIYNERLIPFCTKAGKWGYLNAETGKIIIAAKYDNAALFENGVAEVNNKNPLATSRFDNGLTGWIDTTGKEIFSPQFTGVYEVKDPGDKVLPGIKIITTQDGGTGILSLSGKWIAAPEKYTNFIFYDLQHYLADNQDFFADGKKYTAPKDCKIITVDFINHHFDIEKDELHNGVCTWQGEIIVPPVFIKVDHLYAVNRLLANRINGKDINDTLFYEMIQKGEIDKTEIVNTLFNSDGKELNSFISLRYNAGAINDSIGYYQYAAKDYYFSLITGSKIEASLAEALLGGYYIFKKGNSSGLKDKSGNVLISPKYNKLVFINPDLVIATLDADYKTGIIDVNEKQVLPFIYDGLDYMGTDKLLAYKNNKYGYINTAGKVLVAFKYNNYFSFADNGLAEVYNGKQGVIDTTGREIIPLIYTSIFNTKKLDKTTETYFTAEKDKRSGMFDDKGKLIIPFNYGSVGVSKNDFKNGWVDIEDAQRKLNGLYNIKTGIIIPPVYGFTKVYGEFIIASKRNNNDYAYQLLSLDGKALTAMRFDKMDYTNGYLSVSSNKLCGVLNTKGKIIVPLKYNYLWEKTPHLLMAWDGENYFYVDTTGKEYRVNQ